MKFMFRIDNMILKIIGICVVLFFCFLSACSANPSQTTDSNTPNPPSYQRITAEEAYQMMQELNDFIILDVRTEEEFRERHITGAILIPVTELEQRAAAELPDKNIPIFVYCRTGGRASNAARILVGKDYTQVFNIGGILDWPYETQQSY
jgi:rhodanese-related sulfurtransferase